MPRIPTSELERLKSEVSLVRLIESQGHGLSKRGKDWVLSQHELGIPGCGSRLP